MWTFLLMVGLCVASLGECAEDTDGEGGLCGQALIDSWNTTAAASCGVRIVLEYDCCEMDCEDENENSLWNYVYFIECGGSLAGLRQLSLILAVAYLIHILGTTADNFFCPVLESISATLKLSPQLAGATFLVVGNGAADVFTQIAASLEGNSDLGLGALMGAAIFVTCVVLARIHFIASDLHISGRVVLRDIVFYLVAAVWIFAVTLDGYLGAVESFIGIAFYCAYICTVVIMSRQEQSSQAQTLCSVISKETSEFEGGEALENGSVNSSINEVDESDAELASGRGGIDTESDEGSRRLFLSQRSNSSIPTSDPYAYLQSLTDRHNPSSFHSTREAILNQPLIDESRGEVHSFSGAIDSTRMRAEIRKGCVSKRNHFANAMIQTVDAQYLASPNCRAIQLNIIEDGICNANFRKHRRASSVYHKDTFGRWVDVLRFGASDLFAQERATFFGSSSAWRAVYVVEFPFRFVRLFCIPDTTDAGWNPLRAALAPLFASIWGLYIALDTDRWSDPVFARAEGFSIVLIVLLGGIICSIASLAYLGSLYGARPSGAGFLVYALLAFGMSITWIMRICEELIAVLNTLGIYYKVPSAILGATILAWGNSAADLFACCAVARVSPRCALTAVFATPLFNLLVGLGAGGVISFLNDPGGRGQIIGRNNFITAAFAFTYASLFSSFAFYIITKFRLRKWHGSLLLLLYLIFIVVAVVLAIMDT